MGISVLSQHQSTWEAEDYSSRKGCSFFRRRLRLFALGFFFWFFGPSIQQLVQDYFGIITVVFLVVLVAGFWLVKHLGKRAVRSGDKP